MPLAVNTSTANEVMPDPPPAVVQMTPVAPALIASTKDAVAVFTRTAVVSAAELL